ncbi:hypothetical protein GmarT_00810 [Gimesia maris]|uniref:Uncharacterized protein n=1 Tax=Gimesia maris TaxID=122 RepID=A0ABX5YF54_9PLAN|nr:hypothetical protein GmarT_00810 [Gimesia maris]|tara:strand:- start:1720 stop:1902 length:183 start_codon:yes stop_codon:yes gene_type:complete
MTVHSLFTQFLLELICDIICFAFPRIFHIFVDLENLDFRKPLFIRQLLLLCFCGPIIRVF